MTIRRFSQSCIPALLAAIALAASCGRLTRPSSPGAFAPARGEASWYGPGLHGNLTASGERFDKEALTAAHRTLPFGTCVTVQNLSNRREVSVRINDRGPYAKGRLIDLSEAAARELGFIEQGVTRVELRPCE